MAENKKQLSSISEADSYEKIGDYWDTHSLAEHWDKTYEVELKVRAQKRHRVTVDPEVFARISEQAKQRGILPETLINLWLVKQLQTIGI